MSESHNNSGGLARAAMRAMGRLAGRHRLLFNVVVYNLLFTASLLMAFLIRYDAGGTKLIAGQGTAWFTGYFLPLLPFFLVSKSLIFGGMKLFRGGWEFASIRDIRNILLSSWYFLVLVYMGILLCYYIPIWGGKEPFYLGTYALGIPALDFMATVFIVCTARLAVRLYHEELRPVSSEGVRRVLIIGAGGGAEMLLREIFRMREERYRVIGLVDDDPSKRGLILHGVSVLGSTDDLRTVCQDENIDEILIATPSASQKELRAIVAKCQGTKLHFQILPSMDALIDGRVTVNQIRKVDIKDLLGRQAVLLDDQAIGAFIRGRRILITGAGGSIGSEMCRQVCAYAPATLILLEQAENSLFNIDNELRRTFGHIEIVPVVCDIYDRVRVMAVFNAHRPDVVIHAAAHKHVPLMELNPCEALKNNIFGTKNVADASCAAGVAEFVQISTDKAVNPSSVMGTCKRVAEIYTQALNGREGCVTQFKSVRFGNVLGSAGSVVPTFEEQIGRGGPVTVTHPDMCRYFMTIPEASQLVLQAAATGKGGEIFLLDMGEPVKIVDLARDMITLSGLRPGEDIDIQFTGLRPGEKLFEELRIAGEDISPTMHPKVKVWKHRPRPWDEIQRFVDEAATLVNCSDRQSVIELLQRLVPEYKPLNPPSNTSAGGASPAPAAAVSTLAQ